MAGARRRARHEERTSFRDGVRSASPSSLARARLVELVHGCVMSGGHSTSPASSRSSRTSDHPAGGKLDLVSRLLSPYRGWLLVILVAMILQTAMSIAAPWPLKIILDNVIGTHKPPAWLEHFHISPLRGDKMELAAIAAAGTLLIALLSAISSYVENYFTESAAQWVAYDLRNQVYNHLQRL